MKIIVITHHIHTYKIFTNAYLNKITFKILNSMQVKYGRTKPRTRAVNIQLYTIRMILNYFSPVKIKQY